MNGTFKKTIIVREVNDTVINVKHDKVVIVRDVIEFFGLLTSTSDCSSSKMKSEDESPSFFSKSGLSIDGHNVIVDSRLSVLIWYLIVYYGDEVLIYDPHKNGVLTLYKYLLQYFFIPSSELSTKKIKLFFMIKIILSHYFEHLDIHWNVNKVVAELRNSYDTFDHRILINVLLNTVGIKNKETVNEKNVNETIQKLMTIKDKPIARHVLKEVNNYELYIALITIRDMNYMITGIH